MQETEKEKVVFKKKPVEIIDFGLPEYEEFIERIKIRPTIYKFGSYVLGAIKIIKQERKT